MQRITLGRPASVARFAWSRDVLGEDRDHAYAAAVRGDHDLVRLVLGHAEFRLEDVTTKFAGVKRR